MAAAATTLSEEITVVAAVAAILAANLHDRRLDFGWGAVFFLHNLVLFLIYITKLNFRSMYGTNAFRSQNKHAFSSNDKITNSISSS